MLLSKHVPQAKQCALICSSLVKHQHLALNECLSRCRITADMQCVNCRLVRQHQELTASAGSHTGILLPGLQYRKPYPIHLVPLPASCSHAGWPGGRFRTDSR